MQAMRCRQRSVNARETKIIIIDDSPAPRVGCKIDRENWVTIHMPNRLLLFLYYFFILNCNLNTTTSALIIIIIIIYYSYVRACACVSMCVYVRMTKVGILYLYHERGSVVGHMIFKRSGIQFTYNSTIHII